MAGDAFSSGIRKEYRVRVESLRDDIAARRNRDFFWPTGTQVYCGWQGGGKTISAVKRVLDLKSEYPKSILVSNLNLNGLSPLDVPRTAMELRQVLNGFDSSKQYIRFTDLDSLALVLTEVNNGYRGVIYLVDEIHTYFNALDSKSIPPYVFTEISQQRKQRKCIIGTSQLFMRMAKPFREQCNNLIICRTYGGFITSQRCYDATTLVQDYDGNLHGDLKKVGWFFHNRKLRNSFDTYQKIVSSAIELEALQQPTKLVNQKGKKIKIA